MKNSIALTAALTREKEAKIDQTIREERKRLFNFIKKRVSDNEEAEDILQDVFYQFIQAYRSVESIERITSWLFRVARNKITDRYRKKKPQSMPSLSPEEDGLSLMDILPDLSGVPDRMMAQNLIWEAIEQALEELPEKQKLVFVLHEFEDKSFKEIAEITGDSVNTLLSRKRYAILSLRKKLQGLYQDLS